MPSIRVVSWNIENIGESKFSKPKKSAESPQQPGECFAADYIRAVIEAYRIDVLGAVEIVGGIGKPLVDTIIAGDIGWESAVSSKQQHPSRKEQAIYLWKTSPQLSLWAPLPDDNTPAISLINTIDNNSMKPLFDSLADNSPAEQTRIYEALVTAKYLWRSVKWKDNAYRVSANKWSELKSGAVVDLVDNDGNSVNPGLDNAQLMVLKDILMGAGIVLFPTKEERSPFLLALNLGAAPDQKKMLFSILHCPGPETKEVLPATACMALCEQFATAEHLLMMGDFNVSPDVEKDASYQGYGVIQDATTKLWSFKKTRIVHSGNFFEVLTGPPVSTTDLLGYHSGSSLTGAKQAKEDREEYEVNPYDRFFFKSDRDAITYRNAGVIDLISAMNFELHKSGDMYKSTVAECGVRFLKSRYTAKRMQKIRKEAAAGVKRLRDERVAIEEELMQAQKKKKDEGASKVINKRIDVAESKLELTDEDIGYLNEESELLAETIAQLEKQSAVVPINAATAFATYRVISDHLPIMVELNF